MLLLMDGFPCSCLLLPDPSPPRPPGNANVGAYDRLFAGLPGDFGRSSSAAAGGGRRADKPAPPPQRKIASAYGPAFAYPPGNATRPRHDRVPARVPRDRRTDRADLQAFRNSLDVFLPRAAAETERTKGRTGITRDTASWRSQDTVDNGPDAHRSGVHWGDLLDSIDRRQHERPSQGRAGSQDDGLERNALPTARQDQAPRTLEQSAAAQRSSPFFSQQREDELLQRDVAARTHSETLKEEVKELGSAVDVLNWMHERLFSDDNPDALVHKIEDPSVPVDSEHHAAYPYVLTDLSRLLRSMSPHAALLPLKLAATRSAASYLHGCTPALYASTMKTRWEVWSDIGGCYDLLREMERGAVQLDERIHILVQQMQDSIFKDRLRAEQQVQEEDAELDPALRPRAYKNAEEERAYERRIESRMYFSPSQRRNLRDMERILLEHRMRARESVAKEDRLEEAIKAGSGAGSSINVLLAGYGKLDLPMASVQEKPVRERSLTQPREDPPSRTRAAEQPTSQLHNEAVDDVLSQAIQQVADTPAKWLQAAPKKKKEKKRGGKTKQPAGQEEKA